MSAPEPDGGWTLGALLTMIEERDRRYQAEHTAIFSAIELNNQRYDERFVGQETAINAALVTQEKAVNAALAAQDKATAAALGAVDKATDLADLEKLVFSKFTDNDQRYADRFYAQEHAVELALAGVNHAVEAAVVGVREESARALAAVERAREIQHAGSERALDLASKQMDDKLEKVNEFREALSDAQSNMMPRAEVKLLVDGISGRVEAAQKSVADLGQVIVGLRSQLAGQNSGVTETQRAADRQAEAATRSRNFIIGAGTVFVAVIALAISLYFGFHGKTTTLNPAGTTGTTPPVLVPTTR